TFTVPAGGADVAVRLTAPGGFPYLNSSVQIQDAQGGGAFGFGVFEGDHAAMRTRLAAGSYRVEVIAILATETITASPASVLTLAVDGAAARGAVGAGAPGHVEADESASGNTANDVVQDLGGDFAHLTAATTDKPDPSGFVVDPGAAFHLRGSAAGDDPY